MVSNVNNTVEGAEGKSGSGSPTNAGAGNAADPLQAMSAEYMSWGYGATKTFVQNYGADALLRDKPGSLTLSPGDIADVLRATSYGETEYACVVTSEPLKNSDGAGGSGSGAGAGAGEDGENDFIPRKVVLHLAKASSYLLDTWDAPYAPWAALELSELFGLEPNKLHTVTYQTDLTGVGALAGTSGIDVGLAAGLTGGGQQKGAVGAGGKSPVREASAAGGVGRFFGFY